MRMNEEEQQKKRIKLILKNIPSNNKIKNYYYYFFKEYKVLDREPQLALDFMNYIYISSYSGGDGGELCVDYRPQDPITKYTYGGLKVYGVNPKQKGWSDH